MKPAPFTYHRPASRAEVDELLARYQADAKILAGGQSLVPLLNLRLVTPEHVIDVNELRGEPVEPVEEAGQLTIGPLVRHETVARSPAAERLAPLLVEAVRLIGHPAIRSRGTVVGSVAHADPAGEIPPVLVLLEAEAVARSGRGERTLAAHELFVGPLQTCLEPDEWLVEIRIRPGSQTRASALEELTRRHGDFALCGAAAVAEAAGDGVGVSLAFFGLGRRPERTELGSFSRKALAGDELATAVTGLVQRDLDPVDDVHATAAYRRRLAERLGVRAIRRAASSLELIGGTS